MARRTSNLRAMRNLTATFQESGDTLYWPVHLLISSRNCLVACGRDQGCMVRQGERKRRRRSARGTSLVIVEASPQQTQQPLGVKQGAPQPKG